MIRTGRFTIAWIVSVLIFFTFDLLWSAITTFRAMSFPPTYFFAILAGTIITLPSAVFPRRPSVQLVVWIAVSGIMVANFMYYRTYFTAIPARSYLLVGNLAEFGMSVWDSISWSDIILPLESLAGYFFLRRQTCSGNKFRIWFAATVISGLLSWLSSKPYGGSGHHINSMLQECYYTTCPPVVYTLAGSVVSQLAAVSDDTVTPDARTQVTHWMEAHSNTETDSIAASDKSLVVIFLESFESWPIGLEVEGQVVTPFINSLVSDSLTSFMPKIVTQVGAGRSIDAQLLMLAGMLPMEHDVAAMTHSDNTYLTITKAMKEEVGARGYLLTGDKPSSWNQARIAYNAGVDTLLTASSWDMTEKIGHPAKIADGALFEQAAEKMKRGEIFPIGEKAFVLIVSYSGHNPWIIPAEKHSLHLKGKYPPKFADYITAMNYVDRSLKPFVHYLRSRPDASDIIIVITGDHEGLASYREGILSDSITSRIVPENEFTPLLIINSPRPGLFDFVAGQVDVFPTLLDIMGLNDYPWRGMGTSIFSDSHPRKAIGRKGEMVPSDSITTSDTLLRKARHISDIIIRYDLLPSVMSGRPAKSDKLSE